MTKVTNEKFAPAVSFLGYPDDLTEVSYIKGEPAEAPAEYVALLRRKGLVADPVPAGDEPDVEAVASEAPTTEAAA